MNKITIIFIVILKNIDSKYRFHVKFQTEVSDGRFIVFKGAVPEGKPDCRKRGKR